MSKVIKNGVEYNFGDGVEVLDTPEAIEANTDSGKSAGAIAVKEMIADLKSNFQDGCSTIAAAITEMGVSTASNASPDTMAANVKKISTGAESITIKFSSSWRFSNDTSRSEPSGSGSASHTIDTTGWNTLEVLSNSGCTISATGDISNVNSVTIKGSGSASGAYSSGSKTWSCEIKLSV